MQSLCPQCGTQLPVGIPAWVRDLKVADAMTPNPITLGPEDTLMRASEVMRMHGIRRIPIMAGADLVGLLAEGDLKRAQPSILVTTEEDFNRVMEGTQIARIMINNPITVQENASLLEAAQTLQTTKFGALPVVDNRKLVGIVTDMDLIRCLVGLLRQGG
jgi:acetoin utilization protein AcuB